MEYLVVMNLILRLMSYAIQIVYFLARLIIKIFRLVFLYPVIPDAALGAFYTGYMFCYKTKGIEILYSAVIGVLIGAVIFLLIAKFKYIRELLTLIFSLFWISLIYGFIEANYKIEFDRKLFIGMLVCGGIIFVLIRIYSCIKNCNFFGEPFDPIGSLAYALFDRQKETVFEEKSMEEGEEVSEIVESSSLEKN